MSTKHFVLDEEFNSGTDGALVQSLDEAIGSPARVMPPQRPGKSKQDYETPFELIKAIERRYGWLAVDLAAREDNKKAPYWFGPGSPKGEDSLYSDWTSFASQRAFLNPPFGLIEPWAKKCKEAGREFRRSKGHIFFLTPASVGAEWFANNVYGEAHVLLLVGRLTFGGVTPNPRTGKCDPYPKDCMLSIFGDIEPGFSLWRWQGGGQ